MAKAIKTTDLRGMSDEQLALTLVDTEKHLFQLRFQSATDRLETPSEIRKAKRELARIKTLQRERELVKINALPADQLAARLATLRAKPEGPGKRLVGRQIKRLETLEAAHAAPATAAAKGSK